MAILSVTAEQLAAAGIKLAPTAATHTREQIVSMYNDGVRCFMGMCLIDIDLSGCSLQGAMFACSNLSGANFFGTDLRNTDISGCKLNGANLRFADLYKSNLWRSDLRNADLTGANLNEAKLVDAILS